MTIKLEITREQASAIAVDVLKDFRRDLVLDAHPDDEKLIAALTLVIYAIDDVTVAQSNG